MRGHGSCRYGDLNPHRVIWRWLADRLLPAEALHVERPTVRVSDGLLRRFLDNGALP